MIKMQASLTHKPSIFVTNAPILIKHFSFVIEFKTCILNLSFLGRLLYFLVFSLINASILENKILPSSVVLSEVDNFKYLLMYSSNGFLPKVSGVKLIDVIIMLASLSLKQLLKSLFCALHVFNFCMVLSKSTSSMLLIGLLLTQHLFDDEFGYPHPYCAPCNLSSRLSDLAGRVNENINIIENKKNNIKLFKNFIYILHQNY